MRIGIDIDDTIADSYEGFFAYAQRYTIDELGKENGTIKPLQNVNHHFYIRELHGWSKEEENDFWEKYYGEIIKKIHPYTFAVDVINKLRDEGNEIIIITARWPEPNYDIRKITLEWLKNNNIQYDDIVFNANDKAKVALEKNIDLFIDDSFKNCQEVANVGIKTYILETRTNKELDAENITRVYSWPDVYKRVKRGM